MAARTSLDGLSDVPYTIEQIDALIKAYDLKIYNIMFPTDSPVDDILAGADYEEHGDVGHKLDLSYTLTALLRITDQLLKMRSDPSLTNDFAYLVSQFDNPYE